MVINPTTGADYCDLESCSLIFHRDGTTGSRPVYVTIDLTSIRLSLTGNNVIAFYHSDVQLIAEISKVLKRGRDETY